MELRDYLHIIRARKWVIAQAVVVVVIIALAASLTQPKSYQGEARVLILEQDTGAAIFGTLLPELSSQPERGLQTQVQLMQLRPLAETAIRRLSLGETPDELLEHIDVSSVGQTNIVTIRATDSSPRRAAAIANAMAEGYVAWSRDVKRESLHAASEEVGSRLAVAKQDVLDLGRKINQSGKTNELAAELQIATGAYTTLAEKAEELRVNEQLEVGSGRVVSTAVVDEQPIAPKPVRNGILGVAVGLVFGLGMALLYEYLDNTIKSTEEAEELLGAPVLGHIPAEKFERGEKRRLTISANPGSSVAEAYRVLRNSFDFINFEQNVKTVLVTSAAPGEGKSTVAANLSAAIAKAGQKVVLLSCDFRRPTTGEFFPVNNVVGLSDVLLGKHSAKVAMQKPGEEQLLVLTPGKMPPNPSELLGSQRMRELIDELEEWADWVIIDSPPLLAVADPAAVARWADGVLLVSHAGTSTREAAKKAKEHLGKVGAKIFGSVVWGLEPGAAGAGYGYGYGYGGYAYGAYYEQQPDQRRSERKGTRSIGKKREAQLADAMYDPAPVERRWAAIVKQAMAGVTAFVAVVAMLLTVTYVLDGVFHWGLAQSVIALWPGR